MSDKPWRMPDWPAPSAFPPCGYCGARYEAHEEVCEFTGIRSHRINAPGMPQHGRVHPFSPVAPDMPKDGSEEGRSYG